MADIVPVPLDPYVGLFKALYDLGPAGIIGMAVIGWLRGWVVRGADHREQMAAQATQHAEDIKEVRKDRDFWKDMALKGLTTTHDLSTVAAAAVRQAKHAGPADDYAEQDRVRGQDR